MPRSFGCSGARARPSAVRCGGRHEQRRLPPSTCDRLSAGKVDDDATLRNLLDANTSAVCIVAKSWDYHVLEALQTTLDEGEAMIADSVAFLHANGRMVMVDLEHFFDGYKANPEFSLRAIEAAVVNGVHPHDAAVRREVLL